ncbi:hypothetical protein, partial [Streptomyces sparsus]
GRFLRIPFRVSSGRFPSVSPTLPDFHRLIFFPVSALRALDSLCLSALSDFIRLIRSDFPFRWSVLTHNRAPVVPAVET